MGAPEGRRRRVRRESDGLWPGANRHAEGSRRELAPALPAPVLMKLFYGWVIVGAGIVVTCVGFGAMLSLSIFLQPMAEAMGWSRTGISTAATINWLCMGVGTFVWGALSDRIGTRAVVLCGGVLLGLGMVTASQATTLGQFQVLFGVLVGVATGSLYVPMTATTTRWFTAHRSLAVALVSAGLSLGSSVMGPIARWMISAYDWRTAMLVLGEVALVVIIPAGLLVREPPALPAGAGGAATAGGVRRAGHGAGLRCGRLRIHPRHVARATRRRVAVRRPRQLLLALHGLVRHRPRGRGHRVHLPPAAPASGRATGAERCPLRAERISD